jgi:hypothetical protein
MATAPHVPSGSVDFGRILRFPTDDPDWIKKVLIGGVFALLSSLLIGIPFVLGYFSRALRGAVEGAPRLPEWDDLGGIFNDGLRLTVVYLAYALGMALVITVPVLAIAIPLGMLGDRGAEAAGAIAGLGFVMVYGLVMLLSLALAVYLPAALTRAALRGTVGDGFAVREILGFIRANLGNYLCRSSCSWSPTSSRSSASSCAASASSRRPSRATSWLPRRSGRPSGSTGRRSDFLIRGRRPRCAGPRPRAPSRAARRGRARPAPRAACRRA